MKVLSLFDGISCDMVALERAGIEVERYDAYEIEKSAIEISKKTILIFIAAEMYMMRIFLNIKDSIYL